MGEGVREGGRRTFHSSGRACVKLKALLAEEGQADPSSLLIRLTDPNVGQFGVALLFT